MHLEYKYNSIRVARTLNWKCIDNDSTRITSMQILTEKKKLKIKNVKYFVQEVKNYLDS